MNFLYGLGGSLLKAGAGYLMGRGLRAITRKAAPYIQRAMYPFDEKRWGEPGRQLNYAAQSALGAGAEVFKQTFNHLGRVVDPRGQYLTQVGVKGGLGDHFVNAQRQAYDRMMGAQPGMVRMKLPDQQPAIVQEQDTQQ